MVAVAIAGAVWGTWQLDHIPLADPNNKKKLMIDPKDPRRVLSIFPRDAEGQIFTLNLTQRTIAGVAWTRTSRLNNKHLDNESLVF